MKKITKAIIPAAGYGTRFLPATKAIPKEMLPIVDKPLIQYVVEEVVSSGIEDIIMVVSGNKEAIKEHFGHPEELEGFLKSAGKEEKLKEINEIAKLAKFTFVKQQGPYGNATPVVSAKHLVQDEPFAVIWGDEFIYSEPPRLKQVINTFEKYQASVISGVRIEKKEDLAKYGIADIEKVEGNVYKIKKIVEKPNPQEAPSDIATHGAYVFTPSIFKHLANLKPGKGGELWLPEAVDSLIKEEPVYAVIIEDGRYYDIGNKKGFIEANIEFALEDDEIKADISTFLKKLAEKLPS